MQRTDGARRWATAGSLCGGADANQDPGNRVFGEQTRPTYEHPGGGRHGGSSAKPSGGQDLTRYSTIFMSKFKDDVLRYDGRKDGEGWRKRVLNHLIARCPDIKEAIDWAEEHGRDDRVIDMHEMMHRRTSGGAEYGVLDFLLWGFLTANLEGEAYNLLESIENQQGLEVWRRLVKDIVKKSPAERLFLEDSIMRRPECKHYHEVPKAIQDFELSKQRWYAIGGRRLTLEEESNIIMRFLPRSLKEKCIFDHLDSF